MQNTVLSIIIASQTGSFVPNQSIKMGSAHAFSGTFEIIWCAIS